MEDFQVTTADMLEIVAGGGNGAEYVNIVGLINQAAKELREKDSEIERLREALRKTHTVLFMAQQYRGYEGGPLSEPSADLAEREARAALGEGE